jgi:hypothetical protein
VPSSRTLVRALISACVFCPIHAQSEEPETVALLAKGWVQAAGEIRIYRNRADLGHLYDGSCISGVMTQGRSLPDHLQNHYVAIWGSWITAEDLHEMTAKGESIGVENHCNGTRIALITRVVPLKHQEQ